MSESAGAGLATGSREARIKDQTPPPADGCSVPHRNGELRGDCLDLASCFVAPGGERTTA